MKIISRVFWGIVLASIASLISWFAVFGRTPIHPFCFVVINDGAGNQQCEGILGFLPVMVKLLGISVIFAYCFYSSYKYDVDVERKIKADAENWERTRPAREKYMKDNGATS